MKKTTLIILISLSTFVLFAQAPLSFNYQAVVHDSTGNVMSNQNVSFQISIVTQETGGEVLYIETHDTITNQFGMVNLHIGLGNVVYGVLDNIPWGENAYYLQVELDVKGGKDYTKMNKAELISSVPSAAGIPKLILTDENGKRWRIKVDTLGNLYSVGIEYWSCGENITDSRDNQEYSTVLMVPIVRQTMTLLKSIVMLMIQISAKCTVGYTNGMN